MARSLPAVMRVVNAMFGRGRGGLEENFVVYHEALRAGGHEVVSLLDRRAAVRPDVEALKVPVCPLRLWTHWDPFTISRVRRALARWRPDVVVSHGNRAGRLLLKAAGGAWPVVTRLPNYRFRRLLHCQGFIATTRDLMEAVQAAGVRDGRVFLVPNMLRTLPPTTATGPRQPPVIGAMGRFVQVKGFDVLVRALAALKNAGHSFRAVLGGDGEQRPALEALIARCGLGDRVTLPGWITDKAAFFGNLNLFCVPSLEEAFGIVVLEAMSYGLPLVVTDCPGPRQIVSHETTGLVVPRGDPEALGRALERLLTDEGLARRLAAAARAEVEQHYTVEVNAPRLTAALQAVVSRFRSGDRAMTIQTSAA